jgi:hypothetical protein
MDRPQEPSLADLVAAEREVGPDLAAEARVWADVERRLVHGPPPVPLPDPGVGGLILKVIGGLVLVGGIVGGGALLVGAPQPEEPPVAPPVLVGRDVEAVPKDMPPTTLPLRQVAPPAPPVEPAAPVRVKTRPVKQEVGEPMTEPLDLEAELRLIGEIRAALKRGDGAGALAGVAEHRKKFGARGVLVQERSAHEVEALCAVGRETDARRLAAEFLKQWPDSPHRARVTASCAG